jgi:hypothetical protein
MNRQSPDPDSAAVLRDHANAAAADPELPAWIRDAAATVAHQATHEIQNPADLAS